MHTLRGYWASLPDQTVDGLSNWHSQVRLVSEEEETFTFFIPLHTMRIHTLHCTYAA